MADATLVEGRDIAAPHEAVPVAVDSNGIVQVNITGGSGPAEHVIVDSGNINVSNFPDQSTDANVTTVTVGTSSTLLIAANSNRKGLIFQCKNTDVYYILGSGTATTSIYTYFILKLNGLEIDNFYGPVSAVVATGSAVVQVTEKI